MADLNHLDLVDQIHVAQGEIDVLATKIANADESTTYPDDYAAMRTEQEQHRQRILKCKSEIDQNKWSDVPVNK